MPDWTSALKLDTDRRVISGSSEALANAVRQGADLRIYTEFRHNEHIDVNSTNDDLIREVAEFRETLLVDDRWTAGFMTLRQPVELPDGFGARPSMSLFLYNEDGTQAIARPHLDGPPAGGPVGPTAMEEHGDMPKYHVIDGWDSGTNAPSHNFIYDFGVFNFWVRDEWRDFTGIGDLGRDLPAFRPGCGSKSVEPGIAEELAVRYGDLAINARRIEVAPLEDEIEACFNREWSDGLPVVPPTPTRVYRMLQGTTRAPDEMIGIIPPDLAPCTVEKVAINAVMAGCKPEYLPVVLAAVEAALIDEFCMHGLLCTTMFAGPMVVVNGPIARKIGMNARENALGQGNRANATIGRALQLVIRNVGGGKPGGIDRACLGNPGKYTFCFAEDEEGSNWESLSVERGFAPDASTVTLFAGDGVQAVADQKSRTPESLARTLAACLRVVDHPKMVMAGDAFLIVSPEHERVFHQAGWSKARLKQELHELLMIPGTELVAGAGGIAEGLPPKMADQTLPKFRPGGLNIVRAG
ncbi:MAG: hypothetical protein QF491_19670, partial [Alphaproteobacteria bacterium]|nr:hypothetical protein [Alphaproteobacteria bacterium]